ncbi:MAG: hypothetical protein ACXIUM_02445 [Wenzhouxiangella sp.]
MLVACAADKPAPVEAPVESSEEPVQLVAEMRDAALRDLSQRLNIPSRDIRVISAQAVTWPDGAMGCPQPGFAYTQALVPGVHVILLVDDIEHHYHGGERGRPLLCPPQYRQPPLDTASEAVLR